jgi:hypothetical protein
MTTVPLSVPRTCKVTSSEKQFVEVGLILFNAVKTMTLTKLDRNRETYTELAHNLTSAFISEIYFILLSFRAGHPSVYTMVYSKVSGLTAWSQNCK